MASNNYSMTIEQGSTFNLSLVIKDSANVPLDLSGYSARMQIRPTTGSALLVLEVASDNLSIIPSAGMVNIKIPASITATLPPSINSYDLELTSPTGDVMKVIKGKCRIEGEVTI